MLLLRRILILVAALLLLSLAAAALAPQRPASPPGTPDGATAAPPAGAAREVRATIRDGAGARPARVRVRQGDTLRLTVRSAGPDAVAIDPLVGGVPVEADVPAVIELLADTPGRYPIVLLDAGRRLGTLEIR